MEQWKFGKYDGSSGLFLLIRGTCSILCPNEPKSQVQRSRQRRKILSLLDMASLGTKTSSQLGTNTCMTRPCTCISSSGIIMSNQHDRRSLFASTLLRRTSRICKTEYAWPSQTTNSSYSVRSTILYGMMG
jgi:hypothetical protein